MEGKEVLKLGSWEDGKEGKTVGSNTHLDITFPWSNIIMEE